MPTPTARSLHLCRSAGWTVHKTETWNSFAKIRQDLFGFCDLACLDPDCGGVTAVQTTSGANVSSRCKKIEELPAAILWLRTGNRILIHGWRLVGDRGKRKLWECRVITARLSDGVIEWHE